MSYGDVVEVAGPFLGAVGKLLLSFLYLLLVIKLIDLTALVVPGPHRPTFLFMKQTAGALNLVHLMRRALPSRIGPEITRKRIGPSLRRLLNTFLNYITYFSLMHFHIVICSMVPIRLL